MAFHRLRRPTAGLSLGLERLGLHDDVQEPEMAVKAGGLPAMLKSLRQKAATMKTGNSIEDDKGSGNRITTISVEIDSQAEVDNNENRLQKYLVATDLEMNIIRQVEHYFGDYNLPKDRFMHEQMDDEGWISMDVMLTFRRLSQLTLDADVIMEALFKSVRKVVEVDVVRRRIRRHPDNPPPGDDEVTRLEVDERTVFVSGFQRENTTLDDLLDFFGSGDFGNVCHVRMRYRRSPSEGQVLDRGDEADSRKFLGSIFVIFDSVQGAKSFIRRVAAGNVRFRKRRLNAKTKKEFLDQRIENNDEFCPQKVSRTVYVHGFDKIVSSDYEGVFFCTLTFLF